MSSTASVNPTVEFVKSLVPLRFPVLLVDRVLEWTPGERIIAEKQFTANEPFFGTDSPDASEPASALMLEAMVQVAGLTIPKREGKYVYLLGLDKIEIHRRIRIGETMQTIAHKLWERGKIFQVRADSQSGGEPVISGNVSYVYLDAPEGGE